VTGRWPFIVLLLVVACATGFAQATLPDMANTQDRLPPIPPDKLTEEQKKAVAEFLAARGAAVSGPFWPLLRSPEVMTRARAMGDFLRYKSSLPPRLSEFIILITARQWTQQYEWNTHYDIAVKAGVKVEVAKAIAEGRRPEGMSEDEQILYDLCTELQYNRSVTDATYARAVAKFGEQGVVDAVGIVGYYSFLALILNTARTPAGTTAAPILTPFPQ
jgi:4-carboxymuconolactone decarboxylase